jgi:hypothetical protein
MDLLARLENILKTDAAWVESHVAKLFDNIELALSGGTPEADPSAIDAAAAVGDVAQAATDAAKTVTDVVEAVQAVDAAPASTEPVQAVQEAQQAPLAQSAPTPAAAASTGAQ